jgi:hypothetical protein
MGFSASNVQLCAKRSLRIAKNTGARRLSPSVQLANFTRVTSSGFTHSIVSAAIGSV